MLALIEINRVSLRYKMRRCRTCNPIKWNNPLLSDGPVFSMAKLESFLRRGCQMVNEEFVRSDDKRGRHDIYVSISISYEYSFRRRTSCKCENYTAARNLESFYSRPNALRLSKSLKFRAIAP